MNQRLFQVFTRPPEERSQVSYDSSKDGKLWTWCDDSSSTLKHTDGTNQQVKWSLLIAKTQAEVKTCPAVRIWCEAAPFYSHRELNSVQRRVKEVFILNEIIWCEGKCTQPVGVKRQGDVGRWGVAAQKQSSALKMGRARWVHTSWSQKPWNTNEKNVNKGELHKNKILFFVVKVLLHIQSTRGPSNNRLNYLTPWGWAYRVWAAILLCRGWRRCVWGRSRRPLGSWRVRSWCCRTDSTDEQDDMLSYWLARIQESCLKKIEKQRLFLQLRIILVTVEFCKILFWKAWIHEQTLLQLFLLFIYREMWFERFVALIKTLSCFRKVNSSHPEQVLRQVSSIVDASVHRCESLNRRFVLHVGVV